MSAALIRLFRRAPVPVATIPLVLALVLLASAGANVPLSPALSLAEDEAPTDAAAAESEIAEPDESQPEADEPQPDAPEPDEPETDEPETDEPEAEAGEPETDEPDAEADEPETEEPEAEAGEPETDEPDAEADEPETDEPDADADEPEVDPAPEPEADDPVVDPVAEPDKPEPSDGPPVDVEADADPTDEPDVPPADPAPTVPLLRGEAALDRLGLQLPEAAARVGLPTDAFVEQLLANPYLAVDPDGHLLAIDPLGPGEEPLVTPALDQPEGEPVEEEPTWAPAVGPSFELASLPGAEKTIYLDFDGHRSVATRWNLAHGVESIESSPYDLDGDPSTWSAQEREAIEQAWAAVAEDFAPFAVNVTTLEPDAADLTWDGPDDRRWGVRVVISGDDWSGCGCGGQSYIGSFAHPVDEPSFVYNEGLAGMAHAISHQVGHRLGLSDDGLVEGPAIYGGHDGLVAGWAPIMGAPTEQAIVQWSRQDYLDSDNADESANFGSGPDDLAVIAAAIGGPNDGFRPDDHDARAPTPLNGPSPRIEGLIGASSDVDAFRFTTTGGSVFVAATGADVAPNLDLRLVLLDEAGAVVADDDPADALVATIDTTVEAGTYTIELAGVGVGLPFLDPPLGYSSYGSVGRYTLVAALEGVAPADEQAPAAPLGVIGLDVGGMVVLGWVPGPEDDLAGYLVQRAPTAGGPYLTIASRPAGLNGFEDTDPPAGDNHYVVVARDAMGNRSEPSAEVLVRVTPPEPEPELEPEPEPEPVDPEEPEEPEEPDEPEEPREGEPGTDDDAALEEVVVDPAGDDTADLDLVEVDVDVGPGTLTEAEEETPVYGTVAGDQASLTTADGEGQRLTETLSGGAPSARHDRLDHRWTIPAGSGNQQLRVVATVEADAGDADEGFAFEWSVDRVDWEPLALVASGQSIDDVFDIGAPEGTVHVRVVDTDRTPRQQSPDTIVVDLIQVIGDGLPVDPAPEPSVVMATVEHHFQGLGEGERAVVVTVEVRDDQDGPVAGASIEVQVGGDIEETVSLTTDIDGSASQQTDGAALRPEVTVCISSVEADELVWISTIDDCPAGVDVEEDADPGPEPGEVEVGDEDEPPLVEVTEIEVLPVPAPPPLAETPVEESPVAELPVVEPPVDEPVPTEELPPADEQPLVEVVPVEVEPIPDEESLPG